MSYSYYITFLLYYTKKNELLENESHIVTQMAVRVDTDFLSSRPISHATIGIEVKA